MMKRLLLAFALLLQGCARLHTHLPPAPTELYCPPFWTSAHQCYDRMIDHREIEEKEGRER